MSSFAEDIAVYRELRLEHTLRWRFHEAARAVIEAHLEGREPSPNAWWLLERVLADSTYHSEHEMEAA